ncbi:MAG: M48 family metalloprotease [Rhodoferax sp.]|nr:M48 family metalloprotease [Rhodoferax sp.]
MNTHSRTMWAVVLGTCLASSSAIAQSDAAKALGGLFQSLTKPAAPAQNNPLSNVLNIAVGNQNNSASAGDLVSMLTQSLEDIDEPKEIEIGRQLSAILLGAKPLYPDMALQRYVNRLGRWLSLQSPRPNLPWTFAVLDDAGYNAFAAPGGYIFVTKGLVDRVADESELAGILAHEITHVIAKHHLKAMRKSAQTGLLSQLVAQQVGNKLPGGLSSQLIGLGRNLYSKGLDQSDELEADRAGVALAARSGFDPYGLVAALQQLRTAAPDDPLFALSLSTHPSAQMRLDQLELAMGSKLDAYVGKPPVTIAQRLARAGNR